ncbi:MFS transporter [Lysinibacter cavernae]|uniref:CP family cyanate transporter-like MFS transporter n=1 Tax=Lysinibacter cavernae TaxID=1640652 RepID=A0A7X5R090_9MICO|nr:CP family cyanate transporter-like MFS transporter [Lysinibacter cavernae]
MPQPSGAPARVGLLLVGILLIAANMRAPITSVGPVLTDIQATLGFGASTASILASIPVMSFALFAPIAPIVANRFGIERTLGGAVLLLAAAIVGRSLPVPGLIWVGTVLIGVSIALINVLLPALIKRDFSSRVGQITGLYSAVQSAFAAMAAGFAVPIAGMSAEGWRLSLGIWAGVAIIAFAVFVPQLRSTTYPTLGATLGSAAAPGAASAFHHTWRSPWKSLLGWQVTFFMGFQSMIYYTVIAWWPTIEQAQGISNGEAGWHQFTYQAFGILGSISCAQAIQRLSDQRVIVVALTAFQATAILGQLSEPSLGLLWMMLLGIGSGGNIVLALSFFGLRTSNHHQAASLSGMAQSVGYAMAALSPIMVGVLHDATGGWQASIMMLLGVLVVQLVMGLFAGANRLIGERHRT